MAEVLLLWEIKVLQSPSNGFQVVIGLGHLKQVPHDHAREDLLTGQQLRNTTPTQRVHRRRRHAYTNLGD